MTVANHSVENPCGGHWLYGDLLNALTTTISNGAAMKASTRPKRRYKGGDMGRR